MIKKLRFFDAKEEELWSPEIQRDFRRPDRHVFIFLHKRTRLLPENAGLTYMPSVLIDIIC